MKELYYLNKDNQRIGPLTLDELLAKNINQNSLIWKEGLAQWTKSSLVPEVADYLFKMPPSPSRQNENSCSSMLHNQCRMCPPTYLVYGILTTLFCCMPLGIVAIFKSSQVEKYYYENNEEMALKASNSAGRWCIVSALSGCFTYIFYILFLLFI